MAWCKRLFKIASVIILGQIIFIGGLGLIGYLAFDEGVYVTDEQMVENLNTHQEQYQKLIKMFREDSLATVIHPKWMFPKEVITRERWMEYQNLFMELGLGSGMRSWAGHSIWFIPTGHGYVTGNFSKSYMYKPQNPTPLYSSLNQIPKGLKNLEMGYKKINDDWYIVFHRDD